MSRSALGSWRTAAASRARPRLRHRRHSDAADDWREMTGEGSLCERSGPKIRPRETSASTPKDGLAELDRHLARLKSSADCWASSSTGHHAATSSSGDLPPARPARVRLCSRRPARWRDRDRRCRPSRRAGAVAVRAPGPATIRLEYRPATDPAGRSARPARLGTIFHDEPASHRAASPPFVERGGISADAAAGARSPTGVLRRA